MNRVRPSSPSSAYGLGVDLGTSFTGVAIGRSGHTELTNLGNRTMVAPSVIFASREGRLLTGEVAARRALQDPARSARDFKRRLGDPTPLMIASAPYSPVKLMAALLKDVVAEAVRVHGSAPEQVVLSQPAVWGPYRREQFAEVPRLAGLGAVQMITEPVAAATHYTATQELAEGDIVTVYDLGGGTFDAAVLQWRDGVMHILGDAEGVEWLGGSDFDEAVISYVDQELNGRVAALDPRDEQAALTLSRLRQECVLAKEALSFDEETTIPVFMPYSYENVRLSRATFEKLVEPAVSSTVEALHRALNSANVKPADLSGVLLVGGSSRIPLVARTVEAAMGRPTMMDAHPKHAVALGAARVAAGLLAADGGPAAAPGGRRRGSVGADIMSSPPRRPQSTIHPTAARPGSQPALTPVPASSPAAAPAAAAAVRRGKGRGRRWLRRLLLALLVVLVATAIGVAYGYVHRADEPSIGFDLRSARSADGSSSWSSDGPSSIGARF